MGEWSTGSGGASGPRVADAGATFRSCGYPDAGAFMVPNRLKSLHIHLNAYSWLIGIRTRFGLACPIHAPNHCDFPASQEKVKISCLSKPAQTQ